MRHSHSRELARLGRSAEGTKTRNGHPPQNPD